MIKANDILKFILNNQKCMLITNGTKQAIEQNIERVSFHKIDNVLKLIYQLFLYSIVGFIAKIFIKVFKF